MEQRPPAHGQAIRAPLVRDDFTADLDAAYGRLRVDLVRLLRGLELEPRSGTAIASGLKLNRQLSWQLATIATEPARSEGLQVLPGARGLQLFIRACAKVEGADEEVEAFRASVDALERALRLHAGDRASLGLLAAAWTPGRLENRTEHLRREGFRAQCALLGVQAASQVRGVIYAPSRAGDASKVSMATYQCFNDLMRLRKDRPCRLLFVEAPTHDDGGLAIGPDELESHLRERFELDEGLSSGLADEIQLVVEGSRGWAILKPGPLGRAASTSWVFTGCTRYEPPRFRTERDRYRQVALQCYVPTERIHIDCLMHHSLAEHIHLEDDLSVTCFDASTGNPMRPVSREDPAYLFDLSDPTTLDATAIACDTAMPELAEVIDRAAQRVGCGVDDLVGVRFSSNYVMTPMSFVISRELRSMPS